MSLKPNWSLYRLIVSGVRAKKISLGVSKVTQTNIAPRELVAYNKETQTPAEQLEREGKSPEYIPPSVLLLPQGTVSRVHAGRVCAGNEGSEQGGAHPWRASMNLG